MTNIVHAVVAVILMNMSILIHMNTATNMDMTMIIAMKNAVAAADMITDTNIIMMAVAVDAADTICRMKT